MSGISFEFEGYNYSIFTELWYMIYFSYIWFDASIIWKNENAFQNCIYMINQDQKKTYTTINPLKNLQILSNSI